jgi:hypothetical protein
MQAHYLDGMHLYSYLSSNPLISRDPLGLYGDDAEIDALIGDLTGHKLYALDAIQTGAGIVSIGLENSLEIASALLGFDLIGSAGRLLGGDASFSDYVEVGLAATGVGYGAYRGYKAYKAGRAVRAAGVGSRGGITEALSELRAGRSARVKVVGSEAELESLFTRLSAGGKPVPRATYPGGRFVQLPDGTIVGLRPTSTSGGPTIDIKPPTGKPWKVHIE